MTYMEVVMENISMSEAKSRFSEFLSRASSGERFVILRRERPLAAIIGAGELERLERSAEIVRRLAQTLGQSQSASCDGRVWIMDRRRRSRRFG
jgi:prevent-host-death family protein